MFSLIFALQELGKASKSQAFEDLGYVLVFFIPAGVLWYFTEFRPFPSGVNLAVKVIAVLLGLLGAIFLSYLLDSLADVFAVSRGRRRELTFEDQVARRTAQIRLVRSFLVALLSLGTSAAGVIQVLMRVVH